MLKGRNREQYLPPHLPSEQVDGLPQMPGVYYFYNFLKKRIPHLSRPDDPIHANALGYCSLASRLLIRKVQANGVKV